MTTLVRRRLTGAAIAAVAAIPLAAGPAAAATPAETASVVSDWDAIAVSTLTGDTGKQPQEDLLYLAFVHAAIYDAVVGVHGGYRPYAYTDRAPRGTSATAAAAAAAHQVLTTYTPSAQAVLDADLASSLAAVPNGAAKTKGIAYGVRVAQHLIALRAHDGRNAPILFTKPPAPGVWRPTPPAFLPMAVPWLGSVTPLLVRSSAQFAPPPPPALTSARYARDLAEVKAVGSATSTVRTPDQTATARFFSGSVFVQYAAALRDQATTRGLDIVDSARMFAAVTMTVSDGLMTAWQAKLNFGRWRPSTAIQLADTDGNPATTADPTWTPLLVNPNYPDYPSGYNTVIASFSASLREVVGGGPLNLTLISTAAPGVVRHYDSGSALRADVVDARIWLGIHFRFADLAARNLGVELAGWTLDHYFQPTGRRH